MDGRERAWSTEARFQFIEFRLYWEGKINRGDLVSHFGISIPQASLDLRNYLKLAPDNVEYDGTRKAYVVKSGFKPIGIAPSARDYLAQLDLLHAEKESPLTHRSFVDHPPAFDIVPFPDRTVDSELLRTIIQAIRECKAVTILYQSTTRPEPTERTISPHAIGSDNYRWHIRAYCHTRNMFIDFVFGRILELRAVVDSNANSADDHEWHTYVRLVFRPNPALNEGVRRGLELDYGMHDGVGSLIVRKALSNYLKMRLRLIDNIADVGRNKKAESPEARHLVLVEEEDVHTSSLG